MRVFNGFRLMSDTLQAIEYILSTRSDAIEDVDFSGRTPLFWAVACNKIEATRVRC